MSLPSQVDLSHNPNVRVEQTNSSNLIMVDPNTEGSSILDMDSGLTNTSNK